MRIVNEAESAAVRLLVILRRTVFFCFGKDRRWTVTAHTGYLG